MRSSCSSRRPIPGRRRERSYRWGALWTILPDPDGRCAGVLEQTFDGTHELLGLLAGALAQDPRLDAALERYTSARALHLRYYTYASWALNAVFQHDRTALAWPRDHLILPAARIPPLRRLMLRTLAGSVFAG